MTRDQLLALGALAVIYAAWLWLSYVITYQRGREEATARLLMTGAEKLRPRLLREEGVIDGGS